MIQKLKMHIASDKLLRHGLLLVSVAVVSHICNILFQMVMGRKLDGHEYALLTVLMGVANMAILPLSAFSTAINHSASLLIQENREGDISRLVRKWLIRLGGTGLFILLGCIVLAPNIAGFFHLERRAPIIIMGLVLFLIFSTSVIGGATNGLQMFRVITAGLQVSAFVRLIASALFVQCIFAAAGWGLLGHAVGLGCQFLIFFFFLWRRLHGRPKTDQPIPSIRVYVVFSLIALMAFAVLLRADILLVKHFLPEETIAFARATTIGHIVIFLPLPLVKAMFPKVVSEGKTTREHREVLAKSLLYTVICVFPVAVGCSVAGWIPLKLFYGISSPDRELLRQVSAMGWVMLPVALIQIIMYFHIARRHFFKTSPIVLSAIFYIAGTIWKHELIWDIVLVAAISTWGCLVAMVLWIVFERKEP